MTRGDRFYMFSDGLIEGTPGAGRRRGLEQLVEACMDYRDLPLEAGVPAIAHAVRSSAGVTADDLLLLGVKV